MSPKRILLVGSFTEGSLEKSYSNAMLDCEYMVKEVNLPRIIGKYIKFGSIGKHIQNFLSVLSWVRKANRDLVILTKEFSPNVIFVFGQTEVQAGALAQIRSINSGIRLILVWPDTLVNLNDRIISALPLYDLVATYSNSTIASIKDLGAKRVEWIPLAADISDLYLDKEHINLQASAYDCDVSFIGGWRPEREEAICAIIENFPNLVIKVWGPDWGKRSVNEKILKRWQGRGLYRNEFAMAIKSSKINLNIIDDTNYPAANMRFFEILLFGGLQICSNCPEMQFYFQDKEDIYYYKNLFELIEIIKKISNNIKDSIIVSKKARIKIYKEHGYIHRVKKIINIMNVH